MKAVVVTRARVCAAAALSVILLSTGCSGASNRSESSSSSSGGPIGAVQQAQGQEIIRCLTEKGWKVEDTGDGFEVDVGPEQQAAFDADDRACIAEVGTLVPAPKLDADDFRRLYRHQLQMVTCLEKLGYPPVGTPPSEQQFVDTALRKGAGDWNPLDAVDPRADMNKIEQECPITPPDW